MSEFYGALEPQIGDNSYDAESISIIGDFVAPDVYELEMPAQHLESQGKSVSCTAQSATNILESTYYAKTGESISIDAMDQWRYQTGVHPKTSGTRGDYTESAMKALKHRSDNGGIPATNRRTGQKKEINIKAYAKLPKDPEIIKKFIAKGYAVAISGDVLSPVGGGKSNWAIARDDGMLLFPNGWVTVGGHAVSILRGYDFSDPEPFFWGGQSYGESYGVFGNGTFKLPASEVKNLHNSLWVVFIDDSDLKPSVFEDRVFEDVRSDHWVIPELKKAREYGIVTDKKSFYPDHPATRAETVAMIVRAIELIK